VLSWDLREHVVLGRSREERQRWSDSKGSGRHRRALNEVTPVDIVGAVQRLSFHGSEYRPRLSEMKVAR